MGLNIRSDYRWAIVSPTSMGVRITPEHRMSVHNSNLFYMQATSAETNVMNVCSCLGYRCAALTKFVKGSPVAAFIKAQLGARGIDYVASEVEQGGPWGYRHQFNIADSGFGVRAPRVWNDRAGEVGRTISSGDFDLEYIFEREKAAVLHLSGLIAAMSPETTACCEAMAQKAHECGTLVSFDLNYRKSFWEGREEELSKAFDLIARKADILVGNEEDFQLCLGVKGPEAGGRDLADKIGSFREMIECAAERYPNVKLFATTLRQVVSAGEHLWGAVMYAEGQWFEVSPRPIAVLDRIGGGDGFVAGLLYGLITGRSYEESLHLGWASGALAASSLNDYAEPLDEKQLIDIYNGNARVQR